MKINRTGSAVWAGNVKEGKGAISTQSGALKAYPYGFGSRFEGVPGTNPEELIAAAHAGCFTMALSLALGEAGFTAEQMNTSATITLESVPEGFSITSSRLVLRAKIANIDDATFQSIAAKAKAGCPVSKVLNTSISLDAALVQPTRVIVASPMEAKTKTFSGAIEFMIQEVSEDHVVGTMPIRLGVLNPYGVTHAGAILWFADVCASVLITGKRDVVPGEAGFPLAVNLNAALLGNQKEGTFTATSRYVKKGRTLSVVRTSVNGEGGRSIADVTTSHILSLK